MLSGDEHIIEAIGKTRVVVRNGKVVSVGKPVITGCPLARRFNCPVEDFSPESIRANIEERISSFGMCTEDRKVVSDDDFVIFGASELLSAGIAGGLIDCAVIACDGAGTVIADSPQLVQGIGGKMSGLVSTSPIPAVIDRITENGGIVPFTDTADIDPVNGVEVAVGAGCSRVAVTVASPDDAETIRRRFPGCLIVGVHLTGLGRDDAERMTNACDILSACASNHIREFAGKKAYIQGGISIPVFAMSQPGKEIILEKIRTTKNQVLMKGERLPYNGKNSPTPLF